MSEFIRKVRLVAHFNIIAKRQQELEDMMRHVDAAVPCANPDCMRFRAEMRKILNIEEK